MCGLKGCSALAKASRVRLRTGSRRGHLMVPKRALVVVASTPHSDAIQSPDSAVAAHTQDVKKAHA